MKEIGERLKETRESIGISIEEAAEDLKLRPAQIENIESGNMEAFKDVFYLKYFIRDYSKYLGLDYEDMVDEFNEYLFDYTSKISMDDIKKARKEAKKEKDKKKISSPYTLERKRNFLIPPIVIYIIIAMIVLLVGYYIFSRVQHDDFVDKNVVYQLNQTREAL
ncbi:MAG: helix-turn-helix domain-containing protein [Firmicutes bacterium]|nr:helix-turn-helix domain-containing protein [Bacillota bacterium]